MISAITGADLILHGGDIVSRPVLDSLAAIAPVHAVRGNNDKGEWASSLPETLTIEVDGVTIFMIHDVKKLRQTPDADVVIAGHSHKPGIERRDGILWLNPGSCGRRRFKLPVTIARLDIRDGEAMARIVEIVNA